VGRKIFEDFREIFFVFFSAIGINNDIIQINNIENIEKRPKNLVYYRLKSCKCIRKIERHSDKFVFTASSVKNRFFDISFGDKHLPITGSQIDLKNIPCVTNLLQAIADKR
jgi:hypothetical protein